MSLRFGVVVGAKDVSQIHSASVGIRDSDKEMGVKAEPWERQTHLVTTGFTMLKWKEFFFLK